MSATIRWLKRPRAVKQHYACDKCKHTAVSYGPPDLTTVLHQCRYKTKGGKAMSVERQMILQ